MLVNRLDADRPGAHEQAHFLPYTPLPAEIESSPQVVERECEDFSARADRIRAPIDLPPWIRRREEFIQTALHVHYRAVAALGEQIPGL